VGDHEDTYESSKCAGSVFDCGHCVVKFLG
jgi:hypothetical protein